MNKFDEALNLFVEPEKKTGITKFPVPELYKEDFVLATNCHALLLVTKENCDEIYEKKHDEKVFNSVIPIDDNCNEKITKNDLEKLFENVPEIKETISEEIKCDNCDNGQTECCSCGSEIDCDECNGSGKKIEEKETGKTILDPNFSLKISDISFSYHYLKLLYDTMILLNDESVTLKSKDKLGANKFNFISPVSLIIMPLRDI